MFFIKNFCDKNIILKRQLWAMKSTKPLNLLLNVDREGGGEGNEVLFLCKLCEVILERKLKANLVILAGLSPKYMVLSVEIFP